MNRELLSPCGDFDCLKAAVSGGADAVYLGGSRLNARESAKNFSDEELKDAVNYCHLRGVKVYVTLNTVVTDREIKELEDYIKFLSEINVDGVILQSLGLASCVRYIAPSLEIHASTQLSVHSLDGVMQMKELGFSRAVLARELSAKDIKFICENSPIEIEAFIHGALCMCYSGQCYFSSVIGQRSGNRGRCAQPCRQPYKNGYELSLKDLSVAEMFKDYLALGVKSFKIEGRLKDPMYVYGVTSIYRKLIDENRSANPDEMKLLKALFSRQGFTKAYLEGKASKSMFGIRTEDDKKLTANLEKFNFAEKEMPLEINYEIELNNILVKAISGECEHLAQDRGAEKALNRSTTKEDVEKQLKKVGGTGFFVDKISGTVKDGLFIPVSKLNEIRRLAIDGLISKLLEKKEEAFKPLNIQLENKPCEDQVFNFYFSSLKQFEETKEIHHLAENIFVPVQYVESLKDNKKICLSLPRIITDSEKENILSFLEIAKSKGVTKILCNTCDQIFMVKALGFEPVGSFSLNIFNSYDLRIFKELGLKETSLSCELSAYRIKDMKKCIKTSTVVYGRLPLMVTENCIIKNTGKCIDFKGFYSLEDKTRKSFPVICHYPHRNIILNSAPVYTADKLYELKKCGLYGFDFLFTTETNKEICEIIKNYIEELPYETQFTRGLLFKNIL